MQIAKNVVIVLLFVVLGAALGTGVFYIQKQQVSPGVEQTSAKETKSSPTPTPTAVSAIRTYSNADQGFSFSLEPNVVVDSNLLDGYLTPLSATSLGLHILTDNTSLASTGVTVYALTANGAGSASFAAAKTRLTRSITSKTPTRTFAGTTSNGLSYTEKEYIGAAGGTDVTYEISSDSLFIVVYRNASETENAYTDTQLETLVKSFTLVATSSSPTPISSTSPLLQPTE